MSQRKVYLAIDAHARHCVLGCMDAQGHFERSWRFTTCEQELIRHVEQIQAGKKILAIEEGTLTNWIAQTLRSCVTEIVIADPKENPLISKNAMKGDKVDVRQLCRLLRLGELKQVYHSEEDDRVIFKAAVKQYIDLRNQVSELKRKIKAKFRYWGIQDIDGTKVYSPQKRNEYLGRIKHTAVKNQLRRLYVMMDTALHVQELSRQEAKRLARKYPEIAEFKKIPGIGDIGAMVFDAYIQTPHRFTRKSTLWRYCRLAVTDRTSDGKPLGYKKLDKNGNSELKAMSYRAFLTAMRVCRVNEVRQFFDDSYRVTHNYQHARLNTQRKIISVLHGIWRKGEAYRAELFLGSD